ALRPELPGEFDDVLRQAMAKDPDARYPSAGDLGEAALVAAGSRRRARPLSMVATGEAAFLTGQQSSAELAAAAGGPAPESAQAGRPDTRQWAIALAGLVVVAVAMVAATIGISNL